MAERLGALAGIVVLCAAALGAIWYVLQEVEEEFTPDGPGQPVSQEDRAWLSNAPSRTYVDVDDLRADLRLLENMVQQAVEEDLEVTYRAMGAPPDGSGPMIGAVGTAIVREMPDPQQLFAAGFELISMVPDPPTMYPATGPQPSLAYPTTPSLSLPYPTVAPPEPVLTARSDLGLLRIVRIEGRFELTFSIRRDLDPATFEP